MNDRELVRLRLHNHELARPSRSDPADLVAYLGAVQAQDYPAAKWAIGQRMAGITDAQIDEAFNAGRILRTHVMRPTWHFVTPPDIRWMLALTSGRVRNAVGFNLRKGGFDVKLQVRAHKIIAKALAGGVFLTRNELAERLFSDRVLDRARSGGPVTMWNILGLAELDALICSGPRRGKQFTYALLDERVPAFRARERVDALALLTRRYFTSHGPAALKDFAWWSGLTLADARAGIEAAGESLVHEEIAGVQTWRGATSPRLSRTRPHVHLLPNFDEFVVAYADRRAMIDPAFFRYVDGRSTGLLNYTITIDGRIEGLWRRSPTSKGVEVRLLPFRTLPPESVAAATAAVARYGRFLGVPVNVTGT